MAFAQSNYYVATNGVNTGSDGSITRPWATIAHAIAAIPDNGSTIVVRNGVYSGRVRITRRFTKTAFIRAENPYRARLVASGEPVVTIYSAANVDISGLELTRPANAPGILIVHVQNTSSAYPVQNITLRNNIIHDSYNNDLLKINNGARNILVEGNIFYNQHGSDEHIDINGVTDVTVRDNIFFNDFEGSGRANTNTTGNFVMIKNSASLPENKRIQIQRNVFLNWQGSLGAGFIGVGEDGKAVHEAQDVLIENNLMLGNSANLMRAPFNIKGAKDITFRNNTITGALPSNAFAARLTLHGLNPPNENIRFYNNIWTSAGGTITDFSDGAPWETTGAILTNNLYWNGARPIPIDAEVLNYTLDSRAVLTDPKIPAAPQNVLKPRWSGTAFPSGSSSVRQEFERIVKAYGFPGTGSSAIDIADAANAPAEDILGAPRGANPDIGAVELPASTTPVTLTSVAVLPLTVSGGSIATGTLTLSAPAQAGGLAVALLSSIPSMAVVPVNVVVPEGALSTTFNVATYKPATEATASFTATAAGVTRTASLKITPPSGVAAVALSSSALTGGSRIALTVTLVSRAPAGGAVVALTSTNSVVAPVPATVLVPAGASSVKVTLTTTAVSTQTPVTITAALGNDGQSAAFTVLAPVLKSLSMTPAVLTGGSRPAVAVSLTGPAPAGGVVITLQSNNPALVPPATVTIAAGATSAYPRVTTTAVSATTLATLTSTLNSNSLSSTVSIQP